MIDPNKTGYSYRFDLSFRKFRSLTGKADYSNHSAAYCRELGFRIYLNETLNSQLFKELFK